MTDTCPKCGAAARTCIPFYADWSCGSDYGPFEFHQSYRCRIAELERENARLRADAARYQYIHTELTRASSPHMDGTWEFRLHSAPLGRHSTLDAAIDAAMETAKQDGTDHAIDGK